MIAALHGPIVIVAVLSIAGALVIAHLIHEMDRDERQRGEFDGVDEWEQTKRELGRPRSRR